MDCVYCKREMTKRKTHNGGLMRTRDHVIPLSKGGSNTADNRVFACSKCNQLKGDKMPDEWDQYMQDHPLWWTSTRAQRRHRARGNEPLPMAESIMILKFGKKAWKEWKARPSEGVSPS